MMNKMQCDRVAFLNDRFRKKAWKNGELSLSPFVEALPNNKRQELLQAVGSVDYFIDPPLHTSVNLHDFGLVTLDDTDYLWEINYYDRTLRSNSPNPADSNCTIRVLTLLKLEEYSHPA